MTREQIIKYLEGGGQFCPFCTSDNIMANSNIDIVDPEDMVGPGKIALQNIGCLDCNATWEDLYRLSSVG